MRKNKKLIFCNYFLIIFFWYSVVLNGMYPCVDYFFCDEIGESEDETECGADNLFLFIKSIEDMSNLKFEEYFLELINKERSVPPILFKLRVHTYC